MNRRLDIYLNGQNGLKELTLNMLLAWRTVPRAARPAWRALVDLFWDSMPLLLALLGPVLVPLAPVLAIWTAHRVLTEDDELEARARLRRGIHQNGPGQ